MVFIGHDPTMVTTSVDYRVWLKQARTLRRGLKVRIRHRGACSRMQARLCPKSEVGEERAETDLRHK